MTKADLDLMNATIKARLEEYAGRVDKLLNTELDLIKAAFAGTNTNALKLQAQLTVLRGYILENGLMSAARMEGLEQEALAKLRQELAGAADKQPELALK